MVLKLSAIFLLAASTKQISYWFQVIRLYQGSTSSITVVAVGGSNEEYLVHGAYGRYPSNQIDYQAGSSSLLQGNDLMGSVPSGTGFDSVNFLATYGASKAIVTGTQVAIFDYLSGNIIDIFNYVLPTDTKKLHVPVRIAETDYFMATSSTGTLGNLFAYRFLISAPSNQDPRFSLDGTSQCGGHITKTIYYIVSETSKNFRKVYDYTNGYDGLSTSGAKTTHPKHGGTFRESGFIYPSGLEVHVYVVTERSNKKLVTYNWPDGSVRVFNQLSPNHDTSSISWIPDTEFCLISSLKETFWIANFMNGALDAKTITLPDSSNQQKYTVQTFIPTTRRLAFIPVFTHPRTNIYKFSHEEYPYSGLCETCDEIQRAKCSTCQANSQLTASGDSCECKSNYYQRLKSFSVNECLQCSPFARSVQAGRPLTVPPASTPTSWIRRAMGDVGVKTGVILMEKPLASFVTRVV